MIYHIARDGESLGALNEEDIPEALFAGSIQLTDLVWGEGMEDWQPVSEIVDIEELPQPSLSTVRRPPPLIKGEAYAPPRPVPITPVRGVAAGAPIPMSVPAPGRRSNGASGMAIASLVLGIVSLCAGPLAAVPAIITGITALRQVARRRAEGKGVAIGGIVCGVLFGVVGTALLGSMVLPMLQVVKQRAREMTSVSNARQIMIALKAYSSDNGGNFPDADPRITPTSSNVVFRELFKYHYLEDERVFGTTFGNEQPDGKIGSRPDYSEALQHGENGWAMSKGVSDAVPGTAPLIFEAPSISAWPPRWQVQSTDQPENAPLRDKLVVGHIDGSVSSEPLQRARAFEPVGVKPAPDGTTIFDLVPSKEVLLPER